jgi:7-cyano-7-deazaguanine reductase
LKYGQKEIEDFNIEKDLEVWQNIHQKNYNINIVLPEFTALCPRSGYPDFATITLDYTPDKLVVELKALKLYINTLEIKVSLMRM